MEKKRKPCFVTRLHRSLEQFDYWAWLHPGTMAAVSLVFIVIAVVCIAINISMLLHR
jgi:hypothetical protein